MPPTLTTLEDSTLIKLTLAGQSECFTVLMDRHLSVIRRRVAYLLRNSSDADDVLQDVLLKVWCHLSTFRAESSFRTWMTRIAINEARMLQRTEQRHRQRQIPKISTPSFSRQNHRSTL